MRINFKKLAKLAGLGVSLSLSVLGISMVVLNRSNTTGKTNTQKLIKPNDNTNKPEEQNSNENNNVKNKPENNNSQSNSETNNTENNNSESNTENNNPENNNSESNTENNNTENNNSESNTENNNPENNNPENNNPENNNSESNTENNNTENNNSENSTENNNENNSGNNSSNENNNSSNDSENDGNTEENNNSEGTDSNSNNENQKVEITEADLNAYDLEFTIADNKKILANFSNTSDWNQTNSDLKIRLIKKIDASEDLADLELNELEIEIKKVELLDQQSPFKKDLKISYILSKNSALQSSSETSSDNPNLASTETKVLSSLKSLIMRDFKDTVLIKKLLNEYQLQLQFNEAAKDFEEFRNNLEAWKNSTNIIKRELIRLETTTSTSTSETATSASTLESNSTSESNSELNTNSEIKASEEISTESADSAQTTNTNLIEPNLITINYKSLESNYLEKTITLTYSLEFLGTESQDKKISVSDFITLDSTLAQHLAKLKVDFALRTEQNNLAVQYDTVADWNDPEKITKTFNFTDLSLSLEEQAKLSEGISIDIRKVRLDGDLANPQKVAIEATYALQKTSIISGKVITSENKTFLLKGFETPAQKVLERLQRTTVSFRIAAKKRIYNELKTPLLFNNNANVELHKIQGTIPLENLQFKITKIITTERTKGNLRFHYQLITHPLENNDGEIFVERKDGIIKNLIDPEVADLFLAALKKLTSKQLKASRSFIAQHQFSLVDSSNSTNREIGTKSYKNALRLLLNNERNQDLNIDSDILLNRLDYIYRDPFGFRQTRANNGGFDVTLKIGFTLRVLNDAGEIIFKSQENSSQNRLLSVVAD